MTRLNRDFSRAVLIYHWHCAVCGQETEQTWPLYPGEACVLATLPEGWRHIEGAFYCPGHTVGLLVDGQAIA